MSDAKSDLELDQEDLGARIAADPFFVDITVLVQRKGVTENDIQTALSTLNEKIGKIGACVFILMPSLVPTTGDAAGPEYSVRHTVQVIEQPLFSQDATSGVGKSAELIAEKVRKLIHYFAARGGILSFDGMDPIAVDVGKISYGVAFRHRDSDDDYQRCGLPLLDPDAGASPQTVTITTATAGAAIYYTTDGSYPSSANPNAALYGGPVEILTPCTLQAAAQKTGLQQSNIARSIYA